MVEPSKDRKSSYPKNKTLSKSEFHLSLQHSMLQSSGHDMFLRRITPRSGAIDVQVLDLKCSDTN